VTDELAVVTVTYSPGLHRGRFLSTLSHASERPLTVVMADDGSTDGAPEEALQAYPNTRLLRAGANLGYGTAINRALAEIARSANFSSSRTPMCSGARAASTSCLTRPRAGRGPGRWAG
jgi:N-acetylglucosaminyl-diphospho-decaprenol L-rhamnosyltransferase